MNRKLHEIAKFASGLVLGDFICLWWLSSHGGLPINFLGATWTQSVVVPGLVFDASLFIILVHYGWHIGKTPTLRTRSFFLIAGIIFGVVALAHLTRLLFGFELVLAGWSAPLWISWIGTALATYLSYMSFHLSVKPTR